MPRLPLVAALLAALVPCARAQLEFPSRSPRKPPLDSLVRQRAPDFAPTPVAPRGTPEFAPEPGAPRKQATRARERDREQVRILPDELGLWVRGANYKLRFEAGRASFVPFLASHAPRNFPIDLSVRRATVGGQPLRLGADARPHATDLRVEFDHGAFTERWDLAPRSVEQSFVFDSLARRGELALELDVTTELAARTTADGFEFFNDFGHALYGRAVALDASGARLELATELRDGLLRFTVPASFVARAALPLVIDPVLASFGIEATPTDTLSPDVTYDTAGTAILYCWEEIFSASDHDVWADAYDPAGNPLYRGEWIDATATYWGRPRSASNGATNRFLIVAHTINTTTGRVEVWGRTRSVTSTLISAQFKILGNAGYDVLYPDVGGDPYPTGPSYFLVAYERIYAAGVDQDVNARLVTANATLQGGVIGVDQSVNTYDIDISVSKSNSSDAWNLAWQRASPAGGNDILGARVAWDGVVVAPTFPVAVGPLDHTAPAASSSPAGTDRWVCVYEEDYGTDHDIVASGLEGASVRRTLNLSTYDGNFLGQDQRTPSIDSDGTHFAVAYSELYSTSQTDFDVYVSEVLFNGISMTVLQAHQPVFQTDGAEIEAQITSPESSNPAQSTHDYTLAWHREPDFYYFASDDILGATFRGTTGGSVASYCDGATIQCPCGNGTSTVGGCPNSATSAGARLAWSGQPSTTSDSLQLFVAGLPPNTTCLFFQGATSINGALGSVNGDGIRCAGTPMRRLALSLASPSGGALFPAAGQLPLTLAGSIPPAGTTVIYQAWYRNPAPFCGPSTTNLSNALVVAWTP